MKKKLPIGIQSFPGLIEDSYLYVDKTERIYQLFNTGKYFFFARPRRFGKSLLISTLKEIFRGNKTLFKGLWIHDKIDWDPRPVIHLDFSWISSPERSLGEGIAYALDEIAKSFDISLPEGSGGIKLKALIENLAQEKRVAILIDEYDKPIVEYIDQPELAAYNREVLRDFYSVIKGCDEYIEFFFLTGIAKFTKVSIFSDLNNLQDLSFDRRFGDLAGYTQTELEHYFGSYIPSLKEAYQDIYPDIFKAIQTWYNGYSWDGHHFVYNPFSILNLFSTETFNEYWFSSGTPTFLIKLFRSRKHNVIDFQNFKLHATELNTFDIESLEISILLLQTGYLTVKEFDRRKRIYTLRFPNKEVEFAFSLHLLKELNSATSGSTTNLLNQLENAFQSGQVDQVVALLKSLFAGIAYPINAQASDPIEAKERYFHSIFFTIVKLLGFHIDPEVLTYDGRIDAVIQTDALIYILEFKVGKAANALRQIREKNYQLKYLPLRKKIILLGIGFNAEQRNIEGYEMEEVPVN